MVRFSRDGQGDVVTALRDSLGLQGPLLAHAADSHGIAASKALYGTLGQ
ncbi:MAG: hypothetical protein V5A55_09050 [Halovenus sp.]